MRQRLPSFGLAGLGVFSLWLAPWPWSLFGSDGPAKTWFIPTCLGAAAVLLVTAAIREFRGAGVKGGLLLLVLALPPVAPALGLLWWTSNTAWLESEHFCERALAAQDPREKRSLVETARIPENHLAYFGREHPRCAEARALLR